ncbi:MAG: nuclease-related domain-containing protein [Sulfurovum sp.]|nr:nuclease-related domain-containing protein [Sulfurovum sp.]
MIMKDTDIKILDDKYKQSGFKAETQMRFYLKRAFRDDSYVYVINDLRIHVEEEYAQIDHLVIHRYGFVIIESKSVTDKICVNRYEEWKRIYNNKESGIPSPIKQAKRQIEILKQFLMSKDSSEIYRDNFINKISPLAIETFPYDVLVAISDSGIIDRDNIELVELCKADSITERIENLRKQHKKAFSKLLNMHPRQFHEDSIAKIAHLLVSSHSPIHKVKEVKKEIITPKEKVEKASVYQSREYVKNEKVSIASHQCNKCQSVDVQIAYGKYGYYYKCQSCQGNSKISLRCNQPSCKPKLKKEKEHFYKVCSDCNTKEIFFRNS